MRARRLRIFIISEGSAECVGGWAEEAATRRATETPRTNELIEHDVGGGNEIGIATHVIDAPRQVARVEARDLRLDLPITLYEAVLGGKVQVPTLGGAVEMTLPPGTNSGRILRLRGKGLPAAGAAVAGDLLVTLRVTLPEKIDAEFEGLMRKWQGVNPYDPRKDMV